MTYAEMAKAARQAMPKLSKEQAYEQMDKLMGRAFYFHYNKPASMQAGEPRLSVHYKGVCHIVKGVDCRVTIHSRNKNRQPRCVMAGKANEVTINNGIAIIQ